MDFQTLLQRLHEAKVEFIIVGGYASMMLGSDMLTQDLDVCIQLDQANLTRLYGAIADQNPKNRMHPKRPVLTRAMATANSIKNLYLETDLGPLDCLGHIKGLGDFEQVAKYAEFLPMEFGPVQCLYFDGLIKAKSAMNREKDRLTVVKLKAIREKLGDH